jgi:magnesium-transporting ATPase (P-type)
MKKFLLILMALFTIQVSTALAQAEAEATPTKEGVATTVSSIVDKLTSKLGEGFSIAKENIQPLAIEAVRQYVEKETFWGWMSIVYVLLYGFLACVCIFFLRRLFLFGKEDDWETILVSLTILVLLVILLVAVVSVCCSIENVTLHLANAKAPYFALLELLK